MSGPERWRAIPTHPEYAVSDQGRVRSKSRILKPWGARPTVYLDGRKPARVCRLVLLAFVGPPPAGCEASHLNGNAADNRRANLTWETRRANHARKQQHGTQPAGATHWNAKLTAAQVRAIRRSTDTERALGRKYGVSAATAGMARRRDTWR